MAAPDMETLLDFEGNFETAAQGVVTAAGLTNYIEAQQVKLPLLFSGILFDAGAALDELTFIPKPPGWPADQAPPQEYFHYDGTLEFRISVPRDRNEDNVPNPLVPTMMGYCRARLRNYFRLCVAPFNATNLPYYRVSSIRPTGSQHGYESARNLDFQNVRFAVRFAIIPDAWPPLGG
jgi:hypothetical protein